MHLIGIEPANNVTKSLNLQGFFFFVLHFVLHGIEMIYDLPVLPDGLGVNHIPVY